MTGGLLGVNFVVRQILPLQRNVVNSCVDASHMTKPEPMQIWSSLALNDIGWSPCSLTDGGGYKGVDRKIPNELPNVLSNTHMDVGPTPYGTHTHDGSCLHVMVLMQTSLDTAVLQVAATSLIAICERIGPDLTALHVLPKLKELFVELAFSQETSITSGSLERSFKVTKRKVDEEDPIESHMDLRNFASVVPHGCFLSNSFYGAITGRRYELTPIENTSTHSFYGAITGSGNIQGSPLEVVQTIVSKGPIFSKSSTSSEYNPAKLLLNGVGWSILQSQGNRSAKNLMPHKRASDLNQDPVDRHVFGKHGPWHWFPSPGSSWDGPDFLGRVGSLRDELPWKIRASVMHSICAHHGALRSLAVCQDECTVFTAGVGPGIQGNCSEVGLVKDKLYIWLLCFQVLNDICVLSSHERVASCDGTVHVWNSQTAYSAHVWKLISIFAESSANSAHEILEETGNQRVVLALYEALSARDVNTVHKLLASDLEWWFHGPPSHQLMMRLLTGSEINDFKFVPQSFASFGSTVLVEGCDHTGSISWVHSWAVTGGIITQYYVLEGSEGTPFAGISSSRKLESDVVCIKDGEILAGSGRSESADGAVASPSWIAAGLSSGICRLIDVRSGNIISSWRAHDAYVTKLAAIDEHLLISSSLDRTLRVWNLRRYPRFFHANANVGSMDGEISNIEKWIILYPIYINSKKTIAEGRRISTSKACENPTCAEIVLIRHAYPRDFMQQGRVRVLLKNEDGTFSNPAISSKLISIGKQLMLRIAELVPRHPGRTKKQEPAAASTSGAVPSKSGKGGKKKR
ncbi:unnamed protein product [Camellia sinensis]